jgi:hypothetical protein
VLDSVDERLEPGDRIITGSTVQTQSKLGNGVVAEVEGLARIRLAIVDYPPAAA